MESMAERKLQRRVAHDEEKRLMRNKRSEEMDSLEEYLIKSIFMIVYRMLNRGYIKEHLRCSAFRQRIPHILGARKAKQARGDQNLPNDISGVQEGKNDVH